MPEAGEILGGRYRLQHPLGEGGMATIWAAEHLTMGNLVAVKIISAELVDNELAITRFTREARAAAKLRSPYVVQLFDHDVDPVHGPYIAMELLEGENLADRLEREQLLSPNELCGVIQQVCKGLAKAHAADIVHRDIKPDNIFLAVDDEAVERAKILDFGVAKADSPFLVRSKKTVAGALVGTLSYMSPEQAQGREVDYTTDLWALGVIAFEALVGHRPFDDEAPGAVVMKICAHAMPVPSAWNPDVPPGFDDWFSQACSRDRSKRFASADDLAHALVEACEASVLSLDDVVSLDVPEPQPSELQPDEPPQPKQTRDKRKKKRPVLQLVESEWPPPMEAEEEVGVDIEFELEPEHYVSDRTQTVGPIGFETVRVGYQEGYVAVDALIWTAAWPDWRQAVELFGKRPDLGKRRLVQDLELIGPSCDSPPGAPALPPEKTPQPKGTSEKQAAPPPPKSRANKPPAPKLPTPKPPAPKAGTLKRRTKPPAPPSLRRSSKPPTAKSKRSARSEVRDTSHLPNERDSGYYLTDGTKTVGPVRASMLRRGLDAGTISEDVLAWRNGWGEWRPVTSTLAEIEKTAMAPKGMLRSRPGIESVGLKTRLPPDAPALKVMKGRSGG